MYALCGRQQPAKSSTTDQNWLLSPALNITTLSCIARSAFISNLRRQYTCHWRDWEKLCNDVNIAHRLVYSFPGCLSVWPRSTFPLLQGAFEKSIVQGFRTSVMIQWPWTGNIAKTVALRNRTQHLTGGEVNNLQSPSKKTVLAHEVTLVSLEQRSISRATQNIRVCGAGDSRSW